MAPKRQCAKDAPTPKEKKIRLMENNKGEPKTKVAKKKKPSKAKKGKPSKNSTKNSRKIPEDFQDEFQDEQDEIKAEFQEQFGCYTMGMLN